MDFLKELLGRCVGKTAPVHKKNLEKASVSNFMDKIGVVDLGLPSGVLWATENLGISSVYPWENILHGARLNVRHRMAGTHIHCIKELIILSQNTV